MSIIKQLEFKKRAKQFEYEIILFILLIARFTFKNILGLTKYFNGQPIFGLSNMLCVVMGIVVLLAVCLCLASMFAQLLRKNGAEFENTAFIFIALFFACPTTLPFLFNADSPLLTDIPNSLSGTQMLYPFALFILAVYLTGKRGVKWLVPAINASYILPAMFTSEPFFIVLRKQAILYVPLILLFVFFDMTKPAASDTRTARAKSANKIPAKSGINGIHPALFIVSLLISAGSYLYAVFNGISFTENIYDIQQGFNIYLIVCLLIAAPLLFTFCVVIGRANNNRLIKVITVVFIVSVVLLFPLFKNNYYGLWVPFLTISLSMLVFQSLWMKNSAVLSAARVIGDFYAKRKLLFVFFLIFMASLSNVFLGYSSAFMSKLFSFIPY